MWRSTARRFASSFDHASGGKSIHRVSAWLTDQGLVPGQVKVDAKANEIVAIPELLRLLDIRKVTVTIDAMGCQRAIAAQIVGQGGHYVLSVKENHPTLHEHIEGFFEDAARTQRPLDDPAPSVETHQEVDGCHGRVETRTCSLSRDLCWVERASDWAGLDGIAMIQRERCDKRTGATSTVMRTSSSPIPRRAPLRSHASSASTGASRTACTGCSTWRSTKTSAESARVTRPENLAVLRHLVMNLMRTALGKKRSMTKRRQRCAWDRSSCAPYSLVCETRPEIPA